MKQDQKIRAKELYFNSRKTFAQIAADVDVDPKTLYRWARDEAWDKLKQAALAAPVVAADNFFTQLLKMQKEIASRPLGQQFPTKDEAEIARKITSCITAMNKYVALGMSMKIKGSFTDYVEKDDFDQAMNLVRHSDEYFHDVKDKSHPIPWDNLGERRPLFKREMFIQEEEDVLYDFSDPNLFPDNIETSQAEPSDDEDDDIEMSDYDYSKGSGIPGEQLSESSIQQGFQQTPHQNSESPASGIFGHFDDIPAPEPTSQTHEELEAELEARFQKIEATVAQHKREQRRRAA